MNYKWIMILAFLPPALWGAGEVNVYSARHYDTDRGLYQRFEEITGITVNVVEAEGNALHERLRAEGPNSPADVLLTVDVGRLWAAAEDGLLQAVESEVLNANIPDQFRHPQGLWFGLTKRARVLVTSATRVQADEISTMEELTSDLWRGRVLVRSSSNVYNQSMLAAMIAHLGEQAAREWAEGVVRNFARRPQSNDTGQIRAVAAGVGDVAIVNHYYYLRLLRSDNAADQAVAAAVRLIFPDQQERGTHINLCGAGILRHARNKEQALRFLEFLSSEEAQEMLALGTGEFPIHPALAEREDLHPFGNFKQDALAAFRIGENTPAAVRLFDRVGWR